MTSTIAAIATAQAPAGIGVIRISGDNARAVADRVFHRLRGAELLTAEGYTAAYGKIEENGEVIDEAVALIFAAPHSYTGEDVIELSCHGGMFILQKALRAIFRAGAVPAEAGEFTKRAFLNGKLDLTQAEAIQNLISANGEQAARAAMAVREGTLSKRVDGVKQMLLGAAAHMSVWADYPDEDIEALETQKLRNGLSDSLELLHTLIREADAGRALREGIETVIVGSPNVGKSTLMNLLAGEQKSIVTPVAGTTRDIVEETVRLGELVLNISDTAGLRETDDIVESIGVKRAREKTEQASLILAVFDSSKPLTDDDIQLLKDLRGRSVIAILNKTDLETKINQAEIEKLCSDTVCISAANGDGRDRLEKTVAEVVGASRLDPSAGILASERQRECCVKAAENLEEALNALDFGMTLDAVNVCVDGALSSLMALTGEKVTEKVSQEVFAKFCVGK